MSSNEANAANCRQLAEMHADPADRNRWVAMARFWLQRGTEVEKPKDEAEIDRVKLRAKAPACRNGLYVRSLAYERLNTAAKNKS